MTGGKKGETILRGILNGKPLMLVERNGRLVHSKYGTRVVDRSFSEGDRASIVLVRVLDKVKKLKKAILLLREEK